VHRKSNSFESAKTSPPSSYLSSFTPMWLRLFSSLPPHVLFSHQTYFVCCEGLFLLTSSQSPRLFNNVECTSAKLWLLHCDTRRLLFPCRVLVRFSRLCPLRPEELASQERRSSAPKSLCKQLSCTASTVFDVHPTHFEASYAERLYNTWPVLFPLLSIRVSRCRNNPSIELCGT